VSNEEKCYFLNSQLLSNLTSEEEGITLNIIFKTAIKFNLSAFTYVNYKYLLLLEQSLLLFPFSIKCMKNRSQNHGSWTFVSRNRKCTPSENKTLANIL
jgi:hypothetical protein